MTEFHIKIQDTSAEGHRFLPFPAPPGTGVCLWKGDRIRTSDLFLTFNEKNVIEYTSEENFSREISLLLCLLGFYVTSMRNRYAFEKEGVPSHYYQHPRYGFCFWVAYKVRDMTVTPQEFKWHERERTVGGTVFVWRSLDDVLGTLESLGIVLSLRGKELVVVSLPEVGGAVVS